METLFLLALSMLATESADPARSLYRHLSFAITQKSLAAFYYACSYSKADYSRFMNVTASLALKLVPDSLKLQPVFFCIDNTMISKFGRKFEDISKLFDYVAHNDPNYLNSRCFISLMLCVPIWDSRRIAYLAVPLGYRIRQKKQSKLELAAATVRQVMPSFVSQKSVITLCGSWYAKRNPVCIANGYPNLDLICNAKTDSVIYDLTPQPTDRRGRPAKHGECLSIEEDFTLSAEKIGDCYMGVRRVLTNISGQREVLTYVTPTEKTGGSRRPFFSTIFPEQMQIFCAWQEKAPLDQTRSERMQFIPLLYYIFHWNIEVSYYERETFWLLCSYILRSRKGIEMLVNLINISYCTIEILPYQGESFSKYRTESVQEFRFTLSKRTRQQVFYTTFVRNIETSIKSSVVMKALKQLARRQCWHL